MSFLKWLDKNFSLDMPFNHSCSRQGHILGNWKYQEGSKTAYRECRWCGFRLWSK